LMPGEREMTPDDDQTDEDGGLLNHLYSA
jgi:hypothetical protein